MSALRPSSLIEEPPNKNRHADSRLGTFQLLPFRVIMPAEVDSFACRFSGIQRPGKFRTRIYGCLRLERVLLQ